MRKINKKAQGWGMDLVIAFIIFSIGIIVFYFYSINGVDESKELIEKLFYDGKIIAGTIISEGYPADWNSTNVVKIGIISNNKINDTKIELFYNMTWITTDGYNQTKRLFNTAYDYYFFLDKNITLSNGSQVDGIGAHGFNRKTISGNVTDMIKVSRFTIYKDNPITAYVYIWKNNTGQ